MKKIIALFLAIAIVFAFAACAPTPLADDLTEDNAATLEAPLTDKSDTTDEDTFDSEEYDLTVVADALNTGTVQGTVTAVGTSSILIVTDTTNTVTLALNQDTQIIGAATLKPGDVVSVEFAGDLSNMAVCEVITFEGDSAAPAEANIDGVVATLTGAELGLLSSSGFTYHFAISSSVATIGGIPQVGSSVSIMFTGTLDEPTATKITVTVPAPPAPPKTGIVSGHVTKLDHSEFSIKSGKKNYKFSLSENPKIHGVSKKLCVGDTVKVKYEGDIHSTATAKDIRITFDPNIQHKIVVTVVSVIDLNKTITFITQKGNQYSVKYDNKTKFLPVRNKIPYQPEADDLVTIVYDRALLKSNRAYCVSIKQILYK